MEKPFVPFVMGAGFLALLLAYIPGSDVEEASRLKKACEANIPRTQKCVMQYIPEPIKPAHTLN